MRITIKPTDFITTIENTQCRVWEGELAGGGVCLVFVKRLSTCDPKAQEKLEVDLVEMPAPREAPLAEILAAHASGQSLAGLPGREEKV